MLAILGQHVVIMKFVHDDLTQIKDGLSKIDMFIHYDSDLPHLASIRFSLNSIPDSKFGFITILRYASLFVTRLMSLCFLMFSMAFSNTELFINLKKPFLKSFFALFLSCVLKLMYSANHALWSNSIAQ